jgi:adenylyl-sulfate kinase
MKYKLKKGLTLWLTGLSGSGKSTLAKALSEKLRNQIPLETLDGDEIREHLSKDLGFSREDRFTNIERIAFLAGKISRHGVLVIVPVIAPYEEARKKARSLSENFFEIYIKTDLKTVITRDVKGLYKKALNKEIENFTGVSDPYEEPQNPDLIIDTRELSIEESVEKILGELKNKAYLVEN